MSEGLKMPMMPERAPIDTLLPYLRTCPEANVKELIARNLATGVYYNDPNEVLYWRRSRSPIPARRCTHHFSPKLLTGWPNWRRQASRRSFLGT